MGRTAAAIEAGVGERGAGPDGPDDEAAASSRAVATAPARMVASIAASPWIEPTQDVATARDAAKLERRLRARSERSAPNHFIRLQLIPLDCHCWRDIVSYNVNT